MIKSKLNKKGSHVGIVLSFTIFVTSLIFIISLFSNFINFDVDKKDQLNLLTDNLINKISEEIYVVNVYDSSSANCSQINTPNFALENYNVLSIDSANIEFPSTIYGQKTIFEGGKGFSKFYYYENGFTKTLELPTQTCNEISIKNVNKQKMILESKILEIITKIENSYDSLKNELKIGFDDEFNVIFIDAEGNTHTKNEKDLKTNIFSREISIKYVGIDGLEKKGNLIIKIW